MATKVPKSNERSIRPAPSAQRAVEIVTLLAQHPSETFAVADIARRLGQNRATCHAVLLALEEAGWVRHLGDAGFRIGPGLIPLGAAATSGMPLVELLRAATASLHATVAREVMGFVPAGGEVVAVARTGPTDPFSVTMRVGQTFPLAPPFCLPVVAWDPAELDRWIERGPVLTAHERDRMYRAAELVRELGYSVTLDPATRRALGKAVASLARDPSSATARARQAELARALAHDEYVMINAEQQRTMRVSQISAPVFGPEGTVVGLLGIILGPDHDDDVPSLAQHLCAATRRMTNEVGGTALGGTALDGTALGGTALDGEVRPA